MSDEPRVAELLAEMLDSGATPEEACRDCPELLPRVHAEWREVCRARAELDVLFPLFREPGAEAARAEGTPLPTITGYEVEAVIGRGGMGVAFRARHLRLNRVVALKMMLAGEYASLHDRERFQREAEAVAALRHPNIVQVHDIGESCGRPYFTMEYVEGGSLGRKLDGTSQPPREAATLTATLAGAVDAAHRGGIVHRDLKPSNVLLTADGVPKIGDFGLAYRRDGGAALTHTGATLGTPSYMAPEQAAGKRDAGEPAVDIYALGAVLYELLTGRPPFRADTAAETIQHVLSRDPAPPSRLNARVPRDLEVICLKCLRKEPALRYPDAAALADDLSRFVRGEAIAARPERRMERLARRVRRRPALSAALLLGTVLAASTIGAGLWLLSERSATARQIESDRAAAERAADENLREMAVLMRTSSWAEARAALDRARAWLGNHVSADLRGRVGQGTRDLELVRRLEDIRLTGFSRVEQRLDFARADMELEAAMGDAGIGRPGDHLDVVAARVGSSHVRNALLSAFDYWSVCAPDGDRREWLTALAEHPALDPEGWRTRVHNVGPDIWEDEQALYRLIAAAPVPEQSAAVLLAFEMNSTVISDNRYRFLERLHGAHPRDFWVNLRIASLYAEVGMPGAAAGYFQAAAAIRPEVSLVQHNLGVVLMRSGRYREAVGPLCEAVRLDPTSSANSGSLAKVLSQVGRHSEALEHARQAIRLGDAGPEPRWILGTSLGTVNRHSEAADAFRQALAVDPKDRAVQKELRALLVRLGRADDLYTAWAAYLVTDPPVHDDWYGHAELCLFLGKEEEYLRDRKTLLAKFGDATDPYVVERTCRACLLRPAAGDELAQAAALADHAVTADRTKYKGAYHAFQFVKGLAEYRQGKYEAAVSTLAGDASRALGPVPKLVTAMARHRMGHLAEARNSLASIISTFDWRPERIRDQDGWIWHVVRREAEALIFPDLAALLERKRQPRDTDERLAMLGCYVSANRFRDAARVYTDAFAADPNLVRDLVSAHRFNAARFAALAGCGPGMDNANEQAQLRAQSLKWLRGELDSCRTAINIDPKGYRDRVRVVLDRCLTSPDLIGLREANAIEKLPLEERKPCADLWKEFNAAVRQLDGIK